MNENNLIEATDCLLYKKSYALAWWVLDKENYDDIDLITNHFQNEISNFIEWFNLYSELPNSEESDYLEMDIEEAKIIIKDSNNRAKEVINKHKKMHKK